jgi:peptide/nickel transport system substrate-binding protein
MTSADVKYSWDIFETKATGRATLANSANADAPITSVSTPDATSVTLKLAFPYSALNSGLAYSFNVLLVPAEYDRYPITDMRGSGPWRLKEFDPDVRTVCEKNTDWYDANKVHLDGLTYFTIPEYATQLAQFRTGALSTMDVNQDEVLTLKRDIPSLLMTRADDFDINPYWLRFGYLPDSPFRDDRVRKAVSMSLDRDLFIETFANAKQFRDVGLEVQTAWNSCFGAGNSYWLDPKSEKALGEHARWFRHDRAEAKKLMTAAGHSAPIKTKFTLSGAPGSSNYKHAEVYTGMWNETGMFDISINVVDLNAVFRPQYHYNYNRHEGIMIGGGGPATPDGDNNLQVNFKSGQERTGHVDANGQPDAHLDQLIARQRVEADPQKREAILHEIQRYFASKMYTLFKVGSARGFNLAQPWFGNWGVFTSSNGGQEMAERGLNYWIDNSKRV